MSWRPTTFSFSTGCCCAIRTSFLIFYPEVKGIVGPQLFGYNKKAHLTHFLLYIPLSAALAWVCTLF